MALAKPIEGARLTQAFGKPASSVVSLEPEMWAVAEKAYWRAFPGAAYYEHFHPGIDLAAPLGTEVRASETGVVTEAGYSDDVNGIKIVVRIRPGVSYGHNHLLNIANGIRVGSVVARGQVVAHIGATGTTTGAHSHYFLEILEEGSDKVRRTMIYNPSLFEQGGKYADDPRIRPNQLPDTGTGDDMTIVEIEKFDEPRRWEAPAYGLYSAYDPSQNTPKSVTLNKGSGAHADGIAVITQYPARAPQGTFLRVVDGAFEGLYIELKKVSLDPEQEEEPVPADCTAQIKRARRRARNRALDDAAEEASKRILRMKS